MDERKISQEIYDLVFQRLDAELDLDGMTAGRIATAVEQLVGCLLGGETFMVWAVLRREPGEVMAIMSLHLAKAQAEQQRIEWTRKGGSGVDFTTIGIEVKE